MTKKKQFTLVELLVVLMIIGIMSSMAVGIASTLRTNGNLDLATRKVTGTLHLARQTAILENTRVALVMPTGLDLDDPAVRTALRIKETLGLKDRCMVICILEKDPRGGYVIKHQGAVSDPVILPLRTAFAMSGCDEVKIHGSNRKVRSIIWRTTGTLTGVMTPIIDVHSETNAKRFYRVTINWLKGDAKCRAIDL